MGMSVNSAAGKSRGQRRRGAHRPMSEINVTPFVDVMLVLLIIFMVAAPLLTVGVPVDLPETSASPLTGDDEPLAVTLAADGKIFVQDTEVQMNEVVPKLNHITQNNKNVRIFLRADEDIDYGSFMKVMGTLNKAGFARIGLVSEMPSKR